MSGWEKTQGADAVRADGCPLVRDGFALDDGGLGVEADGALASEGSALRRSLHLRKYLMTYFWSWSRVMDAQQVPLR